MSEYSRLDRVLHYLALEHLSVGELCFEIEENIFKPSAISQKSVYVTGLARAGTTALMRAIHATEQFASLTYDDMPFVLSPNLWGKVTSLHAKRRVMQERAHGDGIQVDFDAPEALEEVFWRLHCGTRYIGSGTLRAHSVDYETVKKLLIYQGLICKKYGRQRYLAKNNNCILRIASLYPKTDIITYLIVFRNPVAQARSLFDQHIRFRNADSFTKRYMTWLAHHEFGATHRPFQFSEACQIDGSPDQLSYWLQRWIDAYSYLLPLLERRDSRLIPVSYERLCSDPAYWLEICQKIDLLETKSPFRKVVKDDIMADGSDQLDSAMTIYDKLDHLTRS